MRATRLDLRKSNEEHNGTFGLAIWKGSGGCSDSRYRHLVLSEREVLVEIIITITIYFPSRIVEIEILESLDP